MVKILTVQWQKIWEAKEWPKKWTQSLIISLLKKGNLRLCQNYRTICLISKVMLRIILNRLKPKVEELLEEEQAAFRGGRSNTEQIFNIRLQVEKHLNHQRELYHNFIEFKKAFDRIWHDDLWKVMTNYNIDERLIKIIKALYEYANSNVLQNNHLSESFMKTVRFR